MRKAMIATMAMLTSAIPLSALYAQGEMPEIQMGRDDPALVKPGTYSADPAHTLVGWRVNHLGFNDYFGIFGDVSGTLELDPADLAAARLDVTIPVANVTVASEALRDHLMRPGKDGAAPDFFGPEPEAARFVSTAIVLDEDDNAAEITGELTLNGVTKPVTLHARFTGAGLAPMIEKETVGFEAEATLNRSDYNLGFAVPLVSDEVELQITAAFELQKNPE